MIVLVHPVTFSPLITHFTGTPCFTVKTLGSNPLEDVIADFRDLEARLIAQDSPASHATKGDEQ